MVIEKNSLVVFQNGDVIAHETHNKAIELYAKKYGIKRDVAFTKEHVLSMLNLVRHDMAEVITHFGTGSKCEKILDGIGINLV